MRLPPGTRIGQYEVLGLVGAGGMGEVYRGRDTRLQRTVAIKVITGDLVDDHIIGRFEGEALSASALNHPGILTVHEYGEHQGMHYLVTEFIDGETLRQRLQRGALRIDEALDIAIQIAAALETAHAAGLIHRDVKPENVMLRPDGYVKVLDFGLAKAAVTPDTLSGGETISARTQPGIMLGTIGYMAPEQVRCMPVDQRADIWSLGVIVHEMLTGDSPFAARTASDVIASVLERQPPKLVDRGVVAPVELEDAIGRALAKDRADRFQSVKDFLRELRRIKQIVDREVETRSGMPTTLTGTPTLEEAIPTRARSRTWVWVAAMLAVVALVVVGAGLTWLGLVSTPPATTRGEPPGVARTFEYWLTVQKRHEGKDFDPQFNSAGQESFGDGWRFRFNFRSEAAGFLYLLNQGPGDGGRYSWRLYHAMPSSPQGVDSSDWLVFDDNPGIEKFWIVWSAKPLTEMQEANRFVNPDDQGEIKDAALTARIEAILNHYSTDNTATKDSETKRTVVHGRGDVLAMRADLEHH
jgi:serine/threonine protein kinase